MSEISLVAMEKNPAAGKSKPKKHRHTFALQAEPSSSVSVAGCFNDWCPDRHVLEDKDGDGNFKCTLLLTPGIYQVQVQGQ